MLLTSLRTLPFLEYSDDNFMLVFLRNTFIDYNFPLLISSIFTMWIIMALESHLGKIVLPFYFLEIIMEIDFIYLFIFACSVVKFSVFEHYFFFGGKIVYLYK